MLSFQGKFPWISLLLMFCSYAMVGNLLTAGKYSPPVAWFILIGSFMIALLYLHPLTDLSRFLKRWFSSDAVAFCALILIATFASILLNWFKLFMPVLLILATEGVARLDLQAGEYTELQAFILLVVTTGLGLLAGGWFGHKLT
jgi:hypothetical protein